MFFFLTSHSLIWLKMELNTCRVRPSPDWGRAWCLLVEGRQEGRETERSKACNNPLRLRKQWAVAPEWKAQQMTWHYLVRTHLKSLPGASQHCPHRPRGLATAFLLLFYAASGSLGSWRQDGGLRLAEQCQRPETAKSDSTVHHCAGAWHVPL